MQWAPRWAGSSCTAATFTGLSDAGSKSPLAVTVPTMPSFIREHDRRERQDHFQDYLGLIESMLAPSPMSLLYQNSSLKGSAILLPSNLKMVPELSEHSFFEVAKVISATLRWFMHA